MPPGKYLEASTQAVLSCPPGSYRAGYARVDATAATACISCPYGSITRQTSSSSAADCVVPPGYFVRGLQQAAAGLNAGGGGSGGAGAAAAGEMVKCPTTPVGSTEEGYYRCAANP
jgi:hypothetical protein